MKTQRLSSRHDGFHTLTKLPLQVSKLFRQGPPLPPSRINKKQTQCRNYELTGVGSLIQELDAYKNSCDVVSENKHLEVYDLALNQSKHEQEELREKIKNWNPSADPNINSDPYRTLFVGRLSYSVDEVELQRHFAKYGELESCRVVRDKAGKSTGYGFVQFTNYEDAKQCFRELGVRKGIEIMGRTAIVDIERGRTVKFFRPRRLGGGLGGRGYQKKDLLSKLTNTTHAEPRRPINRHETHEIRPQHRVPSYQKPTSSSYRSRRDRSRQEVPRSSTDTLMY